MNTIHPFLLCINPVVPCVYILFYHALFLACGAWILSYRLSCKKKCCRYCIYIYLFMSYRVSLCGIYLNYNSTEYQAYLPLVINMYSIKYSWLFSHLVNEIVFTCFNMIHTAYLMLFPSDVENVVVLSMWYPSCSEYVISECFWFLFFIGTKYCCNCFVFSGAGNDHGPPVRRSLLCRDWHRPWTEVSQGGRACGLLQPAELHSSHQCQICSAPARGNRQEGRYNWW